MKRIKTLFFNCICCILFVLVAQVYQASAAICPHSIQEPRTFTGSGGSTGSIGFHYDDNNLIVSKVKLEEKNLGQLIPPPKWILGVYYGFCYPGKGLNYEFNHDVGWEALLEYLFLPRFSVLASIGHNTLKGDVKGSNNWGFSYISTSVRFYLSIGTSQLSVFGGGGFYGVDSGNYRFGFNLGMAMEFRIGTSSSLETKFSYQSVSTRYDDNANFFTALGGIRFRLKN